MSPSRSDSDHLSADAADQPQGHTGRLTGRHVVVTRPAGQAAHFAEALVAEGAKPVLFPVLAIKPLSEANAIRHLFDQIIALDQFDYAIFISPNAASLGLQAVLSRRKWPAHLRVATVGKSSEAVLSAHDLGGQQHQIVAPQERFDSEALLELLSVADVEGKRIIIFRGDGGREVLADTLRSRGAEVVYANCYQRSSTALDAAPLLKLWEARALDAVTITSSEGLQYFYDMLGPLGHAWLRHTPVFVPHQRIADFAATLGLQNVVLTAPADAGLLAGLLRYFHHD